MSVIAWDGKIVAADRQGTAHGVRFLTHKIKRLSNGDVIGSTGMLSSGLMLAKWYEGGCLLEDWPKDIQDDDDRWANFIVVSRGKVYSYERVPEPIPVFHKHAWGSGGEIAMGAMAMGADAVEAVKVACKLEINCGMGIDWFKVRS